DRKTGGESSRSLHDFQQEHEDSNLDKRTDEGISVETEHGSARNNYQSTRGR
ncbi:putative serine/threonine-protein kinase, partial [Trifolium medium]|nr:putative serine/threonine-protein kinase [Trifolium medium]